MLYEDYTREKRAQLIVHRTGEYMALLGPDQLYLLLDGLGHVGAYKPEPDETETWRRLLRKQKYG